MRYAQVLIAPLDRELTYEIPAQLQGVLSIGSKVEVPLGRRHNSGFVVAFLERALTDQTIAIKPIAKPIGNSACFNQEQLIFFKWVADYYNENLSTVIDTAVPLLANPRYDRFVHINEEISGLPALGKLQKEIISEIEACSGQCSYNHLVSKFKGAPACLRRLLKKELVQISKTPNFEDIFSDPALADWAKKQIQLNPEQTEAQAKINQAVNSNCFQTFLLHGITGSGKTEVYIEIIRDLEKKGRGALVLVPEIALTPQLIDRFRARLGNKVAILHSALSRRERWHYWIALFNRQISVVIGARSAVFAPINNLGLVVVDEEHDASYKQADGLRYNARDLAIVRAKLNSCPVILGSATPALESFYHATARKYKYLPLTQRHSSNQRLKFDVIDLNQTKSATMASRNISKELKIALEQVLSQNQQAFILYNRRGFAAYLQCNSCEEVLSCPYCSVTMTLHQSSNKLRCHYCNYQIPPPRCCPKCSPSSIKLPTGLQRIGDASVGTLLQRGAGTERIFQEISQLFPNARIARLDRDSASNHNNYKKILERFRANQYDILVGTQMIAKGHDLPNVTLVGVVDCDVGLNFPDFRSSEKVYQLLTQAAGRAGRAEQPGRVILQTRSRHHHSIVQTVNQNYLAFAKDELTRRKATGYPPFTRLLRIIASSSQAPLPSSILERLASKARGIIAQRQLPIVVLGPAPAPLEKIKQKFRWHLLLKSRKTEPLLLVRKILRSEVKKSSKCNLAFDLDPQDML